MIEPFGKKRVPALAAAIAVAILGLALLPADRAEASDSGGGFTPRVIGGTIAPDGSWPSQAALLRSAVSNPYNAQFCGGTLIDPDWVLTAAHCVTDGSGDVDPASSVEVAIGINDLQSIAASDRIDVASIEVIPGWNPETNQKDFALLELATPSSQPVMPLIAPGQANLTEGGDPAAVAGWGCTEQFGGPA